MEDLNEIAVPFLLESVLNDNEAPIVRHEALIAVGEMIENRKSITLMKDMFCKKILHIKVKLYLVY